MSIITKESIADTIEGLELLVNRGIQSVHIDMAIAGMRRLLASLEAEPVAYSLIFRNMDGVLNDYVNANTTFSTIEKAQAYGKGGSYVEQNDGSLQWVSDPSLDPVVVPLYTAPPAPVSVPDEMEMDDDFDSAFEHGKAVGWNAYRAAMLQSFGNSEQLNSPVIPDGWVACSERMPEGMTDVHISNGHDVGQGWWDGDTWQTQHDYYSVPGDVTHWMPLPAAPQQEA